MSVAWSLGDGDAVEFDIEAGWRLVQGYAAYARRT